RTWLMAIRFIESLGIPGLKSGLTKFQMAMNLSILGICEPPTIDEIAIWIWDHPELGAFKGLVQLGFRLQNLQCVRAALTIVQDHIDFFASKAELEIMHNGPLSTEHLLCKNIRWINRIPE
ncbi:uncharacterized protein STEHIDRAFT_20950, partial [Stereum hirsutum FP-91666 SS1]